MPEFYHLGLVLVGLVGAVLAARLFVLGYQRKIGFNKLAVLAGLALALMGYVWWIM